MESLSNIDTVLCELGCTKLLLMVLRLMMAALCGLVIGWERELRSKEAGVRTHFLVCCNSR